MEYMNIGSTQVVFPFPSVKRHIFIIEMFDFLNTDISF